VTESLPGWPGRAFVALQHVLPQHLLSGLMYRLARVEAAPARRLLSRAFVRLVGVDMGEALEPDPDAYPSLSALFTRALRPEARPLDADPGALLSPVDGTLSQAGTIREGLAIQAKGHSYAVADLLGDADTGRRFEGGSFATIYLSPRDYHRIHMPLAGELRAMTHLGGRLFSVNALTSALVPGLYARNERVVCRFQSPAGPMAMVLVGAIFVGGIETVWAGEITPAKAAREGQAQNGAGNRVRLERGAEMGRFNLGSTVVLLFPPGAVDWDPDLVPGRKLRLGQRIGTWRPAGDALAPSPPGRA
jgi:phosphatidylserine decarboxylase